MNVLILAGGYGTRLSEFTETIPKPMIKVGKKPIIRHIIEWYSSFGYKNFYVATGYKSEIINKYFIDISSKVKNDKKKKIINCEIKSKKWNVNLIYTGKNVMTGGRIKRLKKFLSSEAFFMTYGDGVSNINLKSLLKLHKKHKKILTLSAVRPPARFGAIEFKNYLVTRFKEKSQTDEGWINGGFFVVEPKIFKYIKNDSTYFERGPMEKLSKEKNICAYKHNGFWQCMDTKRDLDILNKIYKSKKEKCLKI